METSEALMLIVAVAVLFCAVYFVARNWVEWRRLRCPRTGEDADVEIVRRSEGSEQPVRVKSCSIFEDPRKVDCTEDCIRD